MSSFHDMSKKFENPRITGHFEIVFEKPLAEKSLDCRDVIVLENFVFKMLFFSS